MEIVVGILIVPMVLMKMLPCVANQESMTKSFALVIVNLMSGNAPMGNVLIMVIVAMELSQLAQLPGNLIAQMDLMKTLLSAVRLLMELILKVMEIPLVNANDVFRYFLIYLYTSFLLLHEFYNFCNSLNLLIFKKLNFK